MTGDVNPVVLIWNFYFQVFAIIIVDCNQSFPQFTSVFTALRYIQTDSSQRFNKKVSGKYFPTQHIILFIRVQVNSLKLLWDERPSSKLEVMLYGEISEEKMLIARKNTSNKISLWVVTLRLPDLFCSCFLAYFKLSGIGDLCTASLMSEKSKS